MINTMRMDFVGDVIGKLRHHQNERNRGNNAKLETLIFSLLGILMPTEKYR
jgi:hypothetical protein